MEKITGRSEERKILKNALISRDAELVAIYGRRRVGKTFLVRSVYKKYIAFEFSGVHGASMKSQLLNFSFALKKAMGSPVNLAIPESWVAAFNILESFLEPMVMKKKTVVFLDEFPWIHTQKSNFLRAFEHFWNSWASRHRNLTIVICGSAASWMISNIVDNKGGLHNRVTIRIGLQPFSLAETEAYLKSRSVKLDRYQVLQIYMAMGGIPHYLKSVMPGESSAQVIDKAFFTKHGTLKGEFDNLYASLFDNPAHHESVIRALAAKGKGLSRNEIIAATKLSSGGTATRVLSELEGSGFISAYIPFEKTSKEAVYRLTDEYSMFYLKFIEKSRATGKGTWVRLSEGNSWKSWSGNAFEAICLKHVRQIKKALGITTVYTEESVWRHVPGRGRPGAQIDLLLDRKDHSINLCEMKFSKEVFTINRSYAAQLAQKHRVFSDKTRTRKTVFITMVTTFGVTRNPYYKKMAQNEVTLRGLFSS